MSPPGVIGRILGAAVLCAFHAEFTRGLLRVQPDAAIGYSSGESAALVALGAWTDPAALNHDVHASGLLATGLAYYFLGYNGAQLGQLDQITSYQKSLYGLAEAGGALVALGVLTLGVDLAASIGGRPVGSR